MSDPADASDIHQRLLIRLREARRDFHAALTRDPETRERTLEPFQFQRTLKAYIAQSTLGTERERCGRLFILTVLLYAALDWHFAGQGIDIEADVQLERMRQNHRHGGPEMDDRLSPVEWESRLKRQLRRLEQQIVVDELYAVRLIKLTALAQAALEAASRHLPVLA
jgi:hypothetical protein